MALCQHSLGGSINKLLQKLNVTVSNTSCIFLYIINKNSYVKLFLGCVKMENVEVMKYGSVFLYFFKLIMGVRSLTIYIFYENVHIQCTDKSNRVGWIQRSHMCTLYQYIVD